MNTINTEYKRALNSVRHTFTSVCELEDSRVRDICDCIRRLLNDELMMKPDNDYSFSERTALAMLSMQRGLLSILAEDGDYFTEQAKTIAKAIEHAGHDFRTDSRK